jgi:hypothetical protein
MSTCTFGDLFNRMLEARIPLGGDLATMVNLVVAYEGTKPEVRRSMFEEWLQAELLQCERCRNEFTARDDDVDEGDPAFCVWCRNGYRVGATLPGWQRTWARG